MLKLRWETTCKCMVGHTSVVHQFKPWSDSNMQETAQKYRRRSLRISIAQPVRLTPSLPRDAFFEEVTVTKNVSPEGFYFQTKTNHYQEGLYLLATLPYHFPADRSDRVYLAQVVRVELLHDGQRGVAVQLLSPVKE